MTPNEPNQSTEKPQGPQITTTFSCHGCRFCVSESYHVQSDSGFDIYCTHGGAKKDIGNGSWKTPEWCPFRTPVQPTRIPTSEAEALIPSDKEAEEIAFRFINGHFNNADRDWPITKIPADPKHDSDIRLLAYIRSIAPLRAELEQLKGHHQRDEEMIVRRTETIRLLQREIAELRHNNTALLSQRDKVYWIWQGDGTDKLESLGCHILIHANELRQVLQQATERIKELEAERDELRVEYDVGDDLRERLGKLLTGVADAIRGPASPLTLHDWSQLPKEAAELKAALTDARTELEGKRKALEDITQHLVDIPEMVLKNERLNPAWSKSELWGIERDIIPSVRALCLVAEGVARSALSGKGEA